MLKSEKGVSLNIKDGDSSLTYNYDKDGNLLSMKQVGPSGSIYKEYTDEGVNITNIVNGEIIESKNHEYTRANDMEKESAEKLLKENMNNAKEPTIQEKREALRKGISVDQLKAQNAANTQGNAQSTNNNQGAFRAAAQDNGR